jgi:hypothetical protein
VARTVRSAAVTDSSFVASSSDGSASRVVEQHEELREAVLELVLRHGAAVAGEEAIDRGLESPDHGLGPVGDPARLAHSTLLHPEQRLVEHSLRVAQPRHLAGNASVLQRVGLRVEQAQGLEGTKVTGRLNPRAGEPLGAVLGDDRRPYGEPAEREDGHEHAGHGDPREELRRRCVRRRRGHPRFIGIPSAAREPGLRSGGLERRARPRPAARPGGA